MYSAAGGDLLSSIGNTPLVELRNLSPDGGARIMVKLEGANPGGSVKDRPALWMVREAVEKGLLATGKVILEASSGNTGIGLAMVGAALGYSVKLVIPEDVSQERIRTMQAFGAELVVSSEEDGTDGARALALEIFNGDRERYFMPDQYSNSANWRSHYETTAVEILRQTEGNLHAFVAGLGTGGTLMGVSRRLKEYSPEIQVIGVQPEENESIRGLKNLNRSSVPFIFQKERLDSLSEVSFRHALRTTRVLARREGIFVGVSGGAAVNVALDTAAEMHEGETVIALAADRGDRYLSKGIFVERA